MKYLIWGIYFILFLSLSIFFFYNFYFLKKTENQSLSLAKYYLKEDFRRFSTNIENQISKRSNNLYKQIMSGNYAYSDKLFTGYFLSIKTDKSISTYPYAPFLFSDKIPEFVENYTEVLSPPIKKLIFGNLPDSEKIWLIDSYLKDSSNPNNIKTIVSIEKIKFLLKKEEYSKASLFLGELSIDKWYESYYKYAIFLLNEIEIYRHIKNNYLLKKTENDFLNFMFFKSAHFDNSDILLLLEQFKKKALPSSVDKNIDRFKKILSQKNSGAYYTNAIFSITKENSKEIFVKVKSKKNYKIYQLFKLNTTSNNNVFFSLQFNNKKIIEHIKNKLTKTPFIHLEYTKQTNFYLEKKLPFLLNNKLTISTKYVKKRMITIKNQRFSLLVVFLMVFFVSVSTLFFLYLSLKKERDLLRQKTEFINMISHELRTPLSGIILCAETINMRRLKTIDKIVDYSSKIVEQGEFLKQLINDILDFSKIEKGNTKILLKPIDSTTFFTSVIKKYATMIRNEGIKFEYSVADNLPQIRGEKNLLTRSLNNFFDNGLKYSTTEKSITIKIFSKFDNLYINISDKGIGIPKKYHKKIFHRFFRIIDPNREAIKGTGLGLAMIKKIIDRHHGKIYVQSTPNKGTTFTVVLPTINKKGNLLWFLQTFLQSKKSLK